MPFDASGTFTRIRGADSWKGDATANTPIRADLHDTNDNDFASGLSDCITKTGKTQPTADLPMAGHKLVNLGAPTASTDAATKQYVDNAIEAAKTSLLLPPGMMMPYAKSGSVPAGWLYCNGQLVSRATFSSLFAVIGTTFGAGDGSTTFALPDMRGRFPRGWNDNATLDPARVFGSVQTDDLESHTHTATTGTESADHTHAISGTAASAGSHNHDFTIYASSVMSGTGGLAVTGYRADAGNQTKTTTSDGAHTHSVSGNTGGRSAAHTHAVTVQPVGGAETRPHNVALLWIIKS
jgi:microcystin-dependent protein